MIYVYRTDIGSSMHPSLGLCRDRSGNAYSLSIMARLVRLPVIGPNVHLLIVDRRATDPGTSARYWLRNVWDRGGTTWAGANTLAPLRVEPLDAVEALRDAAEVRPGVWLVDRDREHLLCIPEGGAP